MSKHAIAAMVALGLVCAAAPPGRAADARALLREAGITGGLVVHIGCGDGRLTASLHASDAFLVHGLDADPANVRKARDHIRSLGLYGKVAVDTFDGRHLPYADNTVNLVVADSRGVEDEGEVLRVLAPGGVAILGERKLVNDQPTPIDEWTHYLHGPDNNAVANDMVVGPPRRLQWRADPKWTRHHDHMSSVSAVVSAGGRVFYIIDEGSNASLYLPSHWALVARDAFNGKLLWKRPIKTWYNRFKGLKDGPADAPRRLVAVGERVYATLDLHGPLLVLDAATGKTVRQYAQTKWAEEIIVSDGTLFVLVGTGSIGDGRRAERPAEKRTILAIEPESGRTLWKASDVVAALTMAVDADHLYYFNFADKRLKCLDRRAGQQLWVSEPLPAPEKQRSFFASKLVVADGVVLLASGEHSGMIKSGGGATRPDTLTALSARDGKTLWQAEHPPSGYSSPEDLFVIDGVVWCEASSNGRLDGTVVGYDLKTGKVVAKFACDKKSYWFHHRCYPGRATPRYIITSRTGLEFIDLKRRTWDLNHWVRGACLYGIMLANGLVYTPPCPCICYAEAMVHGFSAYAPAPASPVSEPTTRLEKGPAYGARFDARLSAGDWPTYRHDNSRSGATIASVPATLATAWERDLGGRLTAPTIADGKVFVAQTDRHSLHALDADTGRPLWRFVAGGRIDSPPTWFEGRLLFGCADGYVYCLRGEDGALAWRFLAAPADQRIVVREQLESKWPVHGSVLVQDGVACFVAGRSAFLDGGMRYYRLDARTGKLIGVKTFDHRDPKTGKSLQDYIKWLNMPVALPDILSSDGKRVYMRSQALSPDGERLEIGPKMAGAAEGSIQGGQTTHLFCPTGFLDDAWFHRSYWLYASRWSSGWCGYYVAGKNAPGGKIMCVGDRLVYAYGRKPQFYRWTTPLEFRLYAATKVWKRAPRKPQRSKTTKAKQGGRRRAAGPVANDENYAWRTDVPLLVRAMVLADGRLFIAGPRDLFDESRLGRAAVGNRAVFEKQEKALLGRGPALLWAIDARSGKRLAEASLPATPVFDGMAAADGRLFVATASGKVVCLAGGKR